MNNGQVSHEQVGAIESIGLSFDALLPGLATLVLMALFIAMVLWAWSAKRKDTFNQAAQLPLEEHLPDTKQSTHDHTSPTKNPIGESL